MTASNTRRRGCRDLLFFVAQSTAMCRSKSWDVQAANEFAVILSAAAIALSDARADRFVLSDRQGVWPE